MFPGKEVAISVTAPMLFVWWLRPLSRAVRVGEQRAVVWNWLKRSPSLASLSAVGMWMGPPKALGMPKPMSSMRMMSTLGAPLGAFTSKRGGGVTLRTSSSVMGG